VEKCPSRSDCVLGSYTACRSDAGRCRKLHPSETASASHDQARASAPDSVASPLNPLSCAARRVRRLHHCLLVLVVRETR
jgi:hypothetical protein